MNKENLLINGIRNPCCIPGYLVNIAKLNIGDLIKKISLMGLKLKKDKPNTRILGIWDFNERTGSVGDIILFFQVLNVLRAGLSQNNNSRNSGSKNKKNIDVCFINDENHPNSKNPSFSKTYDWKKSMMLAASANPYIGSIFFFSSSKEFKRFYLKNKKRYFSWPPHRFSIPYDNRIIIDFYEKNKFMPYLSLPRPVLSRIYAFYESHVYPSLPIVLNIRNNTRGVERNSDINEIKDFLRHYEENKSYTFIIICNKSEIPLELRKLRNVIFSKDYFDSIEYDLAFLETSYLSILPSSGMVPFALSSGIPFIHYGMYGDRKYTSFVYKGIFKKFNYLTEYQRVFYRKETSKWLISQFEDLAGYLKEKSIDNNAKNKVEDRKKYPSDF